MTRLYEDAYDENPHPERTGFKNFTWTDEAIKEWQPAWDALWRIGLKWEWQNSDKYARQYGDEFNLFACYNDAVRLDTVIPLPGREIILDMHDHLLDLPTDDPQVDEATNLLRKWINKYA
jgi:hypothetical protein